MEFKEFCKQRDRMCKQNLCFECGLCRINTATDLQCNDFIDMYPDKAEAIVQKWASEHPVITNEYKFKQVFGYKPDTGTCVKHECASEVCLGCKYNNWWNQEYKAPESVEE